MVRCNILVVFLALLSSTTSVASHLRFFSVWSVGSGPVSRPARGINSSFVNFFFDVNETSTLKSLCAAGFGPSLLHVRDVLFWPRHAPQRGLRPDYRQRWNRTLAELAPLISSGDAFGVFLGDELCWDCVTHHDLTAAADLVRATLPQQLPAAVAERLGGLTRPVIFYNEAFPVVDDCPERAVCLRRQQDVLREIEGL